MNGQLMPLTMASQGEKVTVADIKAGCGLNKRLSDMGLTPGTTLKVITSHGPGPMLIEIRGSKLVLGHGIAQKVMVRMGGND